MTDLPWDDVKVAFAVDDEDALWAASECGVLSLPHGWELIETDASGARCVAVFRVDGVPPTREDGEAVCGAIRAFEAQAAEIVAVALAKEDRQ